MFVLAHGNGCIFDNVLNASTKMTELIYNLWQTINLQLFLGGSFTLNLQKLKLKDKYGTRSNVSSSLLVTIGKFRRNDKFPVISFNHLLHGLSPALNKSQCVLRYGERSKGRAYLDDLVGSKGCGLATLVRAVEFGSVNKGSFVVALTRSADLRVNLSFSRLDNAVAQTRRKSDDSILLGVLLKELLSFRVGSEGDGNEKGDKQDTHIFVTRSQNSDTDVGQQARQGYSSTPKRT